MSRASVAADFDRIADALSRAKSAEVLSAPERRLLDQVPLQARTALDAGCGHGLLSRSMARRGINVLGMDLSPAMISLARRSTPDELSVEFMVADILDPGALERLFDVVVCVNVVHHGDFTKMVTRLAAAVAPGGRLLVQDVVTRSNRHYFFRNLLGAGLTGLDIMRVGRSGEVARLYREHGREERYLTPDEADALYREHLPGARVQHSVEWRYMAIWDRPGPTSGR